jgi:hypothetical protein
MSRVVKRGQARRDRTGPLLLFGLLALGFLPSLSQEFDLSRLLVALESAVERMQAPMQALLPAGDNPAAPCPQAESQARLLLALVPGAGALLPSLPPSHPGLPEGPGPIGWGRLPRSSGPPRAPPPLA